MYPVRYIAEFEREQGRARTFFRLILAVPWYVLGSAYALAALAVAFLAWFALLFTGRYPRDLYEFNAGFLRFYARANAFFYLQTDRWPPFGFGEDPAYPIRAEVDPPRDSYSRAKVLFRLVLGVPAMFMLGLMGYLYQVASAIAWFHIVFVGRSSGGVHNALSTGLAYQLRATAYFLLLTETLPPVSDQDPVPGPTRRGAPA